METPIYTVPPVERAIKLLRYIGDGHPCRNLSQSSKDLGINRTTLIRLIKTLLVNGMIEESHPGAGYQLGPGLIILAAQSIHGRDIVQVTQSILADLAAETGMSAHVGILDGTDIVYLNRQAPNSHLVSNIRAGSRLPAHAASIGRAILAALPSSQVRELFENKPLDLKTEKTPATLQMLLAQRTQDREAGFAWSVGNFETGIGSCAAAIIDHTGKPVGGLNVSGPEHFFSAEAGADVEKVQAAVVKAARTASMSLGYTPQG